ncbi:MAG: AAA family ATPase [Chloroflexota bacterium]|nr:AAA family ATPase [Chloroflexota bacterium]
MNPFRRLTRQLRRRSAGVALRARRRPRTSVALGVVAVLAIVLGGGAVVLATGSGSPTTAGPSFTVRDGWTLAELERHVAAGEVDAITAAPATTADPAGQLLARLRTGEVVAIDLTVAAPDAVAALTALGYGSILTTEAIGVGRPPTSALTSVMAVVFPLALLVVTVVFLWRVARRGTGSGRDRGTAFTTIMPPVPVTSGSGQALTRAAAGNLPPVALADVAGCDEAKHELTETIDFLKSPERFRKLGARIPRGIMLYGPPGTGKTMLARAVAAEAGVPFLYASGSEFVEKYVGVGAKRVRDLFAQARKLGRAVIFFDEFDALGKARGGTNSHEEREQTLNQLLVELDGFSTTEDIIVIAATNRLDILDSAILRPGRFNRKVHVGMPDVKGRREILAVHARNKPLGPTTNLDDLARKTYGFSGAMLADLLNEAAIMTARREGEAIDTDDLHGGWLKVAVGTSRRRSMDERERSIIAAHEVGHAICGKVHGDKRKVEEISLFAHGDALGVTVSSQEDNDLPSESDLRSRLVALMGGRAAEEILFHEVTGGASNDFEAANRIATSMVTKWGMGHDPDDRDGGVSGRGQLSFFVQTNGNEIPSEIRPAATRAIRAILDEAYAEASRTLIANLDTLRRLAAYLVEHERVDGETFDELFDGRRAVPNVGDEWRAATSRPRDWGDVVDLADRRMKRAPAQIAVGAGLAASAAVAGGRDGPRAEVAIMSPSDDAGTAATAASIVTGSVGGGDPLASSTTRTLVDPGGTEPALVALGLVADAGATQSPVVPPTVRPNLTHRRAAAGRRARLLAASLLRRAEARLRAGELEADRG